MKINEEEVYDPYDMSLYANPKSQQDSSQVNDNNIEENQENITDEKTELKPKKKSKRKKTDENDEKNNGNEFNENNIDNNKLQEQVKNIISGEPNCNNIENDEDILDDEIDEEDEPLTEFDKINTIGCVKNTLNEIAKNQQIAKIIKDSLGDKYNILNDIFIKEEQRINTKKKNNNNNN